MNRASRQSLARALFGAVVLGAAACAGYALPYPERWNEDLTDMRRSDAWRLLGVPDIDYIEKGFDGWNRKFSWGLGYLSWDEDFRKQWKRPG